MIKAIKQRFSNFFHSEEVPYGLAIVRISLPLIMLLPMLQRLPRVRELYSTDGAICQLSQVYGDGSWMPEFSGSVAVALYGIMIFCLLTSSLGWMTRVSLIVGTTLFTYFNMLDVVSTITKYSVIAIDAMVVLSLSKCGNVWSVDRWLAKRRLTAAGQPIPPPEKSSIWVARLIQILCGCTYFGAAITKLQTDAFFSGDQMRFWMLTNVNFNNPIGEYMALMPALLVVSAYCAIVWEMTFIFTVWRGWMRPFMLAAGCFFHIMTTITLGLIIFPLVCMSIYFVFMTEADWMRAMAFRDRIFKRTDRRVAAPTPVLATPSSFIPAALRVPSSVAFATLLVLIAVVAVEGEYQYDLYGANGGNGPLPLKEIDRDEALAMINSRVPLAEKDKFFSFDIGTFAISGIVANRRNEFTYGETVYAQCSLNPPHEDLLVECDVVDENGSLLHHFQTFATREMMRCDFWYIVGREMTPGNYAFVLKSSGKEVGRQKFSIRDTAVLAN